MKQRIREISQNFKSTKHEKAVPQQESQKVLFKSDNLKAHTNKLEMQHESVITRLNDVAILIEKENA